MKEHRLEDTIANETITVSPDKSEGFASLFAEFASTYLPSPAGKKHAAFYASGREQGRANWAAIQAAVTRGEDVTDRVLLLLLPYADTVGNRQRGAWIHVAPSVASDLRAWYESKPKEQRTNPEDWPKIANAVLSFVQQCVDDPRQLSSACADFTRLPYSKGFQAGMLTPILNALRPDDFMLINNKSRRTLNHFAGANFTPALADYAASNAALKTLVSALGQYMQTPQDGIAGKADLFDMFSHWLVAVKRYFADARPDPDSVEEPMGQPFDQLFRDRDEARWAFGLMHDTAHQLGLNGPDANQLSVSLRREFTKYHLHFTYGRWLIVGFDGRKGGLFEVALALHTEDVGIKPARYGQFSTSDGQTPAFFVALPIKEIRPLAGKVKTVFEETVAQAREQFGHWKANPRRSCNILQLAQAIFDPEQLEALLNEGLPPGTIVDVDPVEPAIVRYWKIAPGENAWQWEECRREGFIAIGWEELGDLTGVSQQDFAARCDAARAIHPDWTARALNQVWKFARIQPGDRIVANRGKSTVVGIGTVTGAYHFMPGIRHGHRLPVHWDDTAERAVSEAGWQSTLLELDREKFEALTHASTPPPVSVTGVNPVYSLEDCKRDTCMDIGTCQAFETKKRQSLHTSVG